ncbi:MAG: ImmA/IrrE family metallo-endopeptidase [Lactobacillaceae bacterium]|jgi:Zn-dependent peptidase ImmA (M78 family)|nr:ImmA/IrrE family metallo-endopeptidase [Lactobacillaceae bacterium]
MKKYGDLFPKKFLDQVNNVNKRFEVKLDNPIQASEEMEHEYIDIETILHRTGFEIIYDPNLTGSGKIVEKKIYINSSEVETRKRFSMAHELGHAMQGTDIASRNTEEDVYTSVEKLDEIFANKFAAQLLMPRKLVVEYITDEINAQNLNAMSLNTNDIDTITSALASRLKVSLGAMEFRLQNLNVFTNA